MRVEQTAWCFSGFRRPLTPALPQGERELHSLIPISPSLVDQRLVPLPPPAKGRASVLTSLGINPDSSSRFYFLQNRSHKKTAFTGCFDTACKGGFCFYCVIT